MASDVVFRGPYTAQPIHGIKGFTELIAMFHSAFADLKITEEAMVAEGDTVESGAPLFTVQPPADAD